MSLSTLHVITRLTLGGSAENTVASMVALGAAGYPGPLAVGVAESDRASVDDARRRGVTLVDVPGLGREVGARDLSALVQLWRLIRVERPAIVHTHTSKAGFVGRLAARLARVPAIIHQPHGHIFYGYYSARRTAFYVSLERLAARWTDRIVTLTERGTEEHLARGIGRRAQYRSVPSGVPTAELRAAAPSRAIARDRLGLPADAFVVAGLGRLVPVKGFDLLVTALRELAAAVPAARVVLVGDGPDREALEERARTLGVGDRLLVTGATPDITIALAAADVLAAPSRNEGMGRALVEAMALGLPVVGAEVGGIPVVVADGETGRLVPTGDPAALAQALIELGRDEALRAKWGAAAAVRAEAFSTDVAHAAMRAIYDELAREKGLR
ncbi:MAG TPA: glycosyltransferase [Methylomirabilota bacterium]|nr:glycosyltransferase [Methylomirabilota bacterium]